MSDENNVNYLIRMFHVYRRYGNKTALFDINIDVKKNEFIYVTGPSGAGKSTLLKLLYIGEPISEGQIIVDGVNLTRISKNKIPLLRRKFGIIFQEFKLIPTKTVFENVALVLEASDRPKRFIQKKVSSMLRAVGMEDRQNSFPLSLSGGEQQRVAIARAVAGDPKIILADEPTGSLDEESAEQVIELIKGFHSRGSTIIITTHDTKLIRKTGGRMIHLKQGRLWFPSNQG
ncbi:cell division ATP-binding protein FtsE [Desulfobacterium sp. N47]|uniref:Cell division ATP-binding protein FtsE n=1 Tax=uncultured Desulfobacterium sp. TaxID=201089 RepID=E1YEY6_9BACT|nr:Cell division ATP-binding protein ftsE [uncultured Desulfobacterium sp.]